MSATVLTADRRFLRRVMLVLVSLTLATGGLAGFTTAQALHAAAPLCNENCP